MLAGIEALDINKNSNNRKIEFILVQEPEILDEASTKPEVINAIRICKRHGFPSNIAQITCERLRRVMTGECYNGDTDYKWLKDNEPYGGSLDVYEVASVSNAEHVCGKTPFDVIDETLYGQEKFANIEDKIRWVCENFEITQDKLVEKK